MQQTELWHDSILDAVGAAISASGGRGTVAKKLWPALEESSRTARLRASLNPDHAQKLDPEELLMIAKLARAAGDFSIVNFLARELGFEFKPISNADAKKRARKARMSVLLAEVAKLAAEEE